MKIYKYTEGTQHNPSIKYNVIIKRYNITITKLTYPNGFTWYVWCYYRKNNKRCDIYSNIAKDSFKLMLKNALINESEYLQLLLLIK